MLLQTGVSYYIILMYGLDYEHWFVEQTVLPFTALRYSSRYFPTAANEPEILHMHRKWLISALKNQADSLQLQPRKHNIAASYISARE